MTPAPADERWVEEPPKRPGRTAYERDRARVVRTLTASRPLDFWRRLMAEIGLG